ncbi:MAG: acyl carrier protein [Bacteroides helcogenes]|nr:acyl carrier protein [Bacteroides helcogenes]MDY5237022.1 acyl carrier protein [Bacteroides helcogenes]
MNMQKIILDELNLIFQEVLKREDISLTNETTAQDVEGWDSLTNMQLINKIEKQFNVRFTFRDIVRLKNVGDICNSISIKVQ